MTNTLPIVFKAYTAKGQLIVSKPINPFDSNRIIDIYCDMWHLNVVSYYVKQGRTSKHYFIKQDRHAQLTKHRPVQKNATL